MANSLECPAHRKQAVGPAADPAGGFGGDGRPDESQRHLGTGVQSALLNQDAGVMRDGPAGPWGLQKVYAFQKACVAF
jgi:hypothetical protein